MANEEKKMCIVSQQQLNEVVERGLNLVRVSFKDETEPIILAYKEKPSGVSISVFLKEKIQVFSEISNLTWFGKNKDLE